MLKTVAALLLVSGVGSGALVATHPNSVSIPSQEQTESILKSKNQPSDAENSSLGSLALAQASDDKAEETNSTEAADNTSDHGTGSSEYWRIGNHRVKITDSLLTLFTALLMVFTGILCRIGWIQNQHFRQVERAFVFLKSFNMNPAGVPGVVGADGKAAEDVMTGLAISPIWANSGNTPTRRMLTRYNRYYGQQLVPDFDFRDNVEPGVPNTPRPTLIGPKAEITAAALHFSTAEIDAIANGRAHGYLWGLGRIRRRF
jgi:hypothetical protein